MADNKKNPQTVSSRQLLINADIQPSLKFRIEEAYKTIRTNIMLSVMKKGCKMIVVSSAGPSEGKTTTTINLAISISQAEQRVLLIDGDLRKPKVHHYFSVSNSPGLTNYIGDVLSGKSRVDLYGVIHPTEFENLSVMCSGSIPPNPAEILGSEAVAEFLNDVSKDFDYIIIDTPPINVVSDALPLVRESDGVVLVVRTNHSTHPDLQKALSSLEFIDAKILGFVVNFDESKGTKYSKSGYGYGYGYSSYNYNYNNYNYASYNNYKSKRYKSYKAEDTRNE